MAVNKGGRPKKIIDQEQFESLCEIQCTKEEICHVLKCDEKTLTRWCNDTYGEGFSEVYLKEASKGKISLRRSMFKMAQTNTTMAIWLSKQHLGMKEPKIEVEIPYDEIEEDMGDYEK